SSTWKYSFSNEEIDKIKENMAKFQKSKVALISSNGKLKGGELVILNEEEFLKCIGDEWVGENPYISVLKEKYHQVRVYGRGLGRDDAIIPKMELTAEKL